MDFSPQTVRSAGFRTVKKGYDQSEVDDFKEKVAAAIETAQNQATAMEARARAAVAKLQEVSQQVTSGTREAGASQSHSDEDAEMISRTLLLAQRTADTTVAQANADAESITVRARVDATTVIDNARAMADKLLDEARLEARRSAENERIKAENEVQALLARRDFLVSDVDHLEHHLDAQRERLRDAADAGMGAVERARLLQLVSRRGNVSLAGESLRLANELLHERRRLHLLARLIVDRARFLVREVGAQHLAGQIIRALKVARGDRCARLTQRIVARRHERIDIDGRIRIACFLQQLPGRVERRIHAQDQRAPFHDLGGASLFIERQRLLKRREHSIPDC